jgi:hypothetical protein
VEWGITNVDSIIAYFGDKIVEEEERWQAYAEGDGVAWP